MVNRRQSRVFLPILALALAGIPTPERAQTSPANVPTPPVIMSRKQATRMLVTQQVPEYPAVAKVNYVQGSVQLELTVDGAGKVENAHVLQGNPVLADSALKATRQWIYQPLRTPSGPSSFITTVELKFTLDNWHAQTPEEREDRDFLTPQKAERDFMHQVKPPQVVRTSEIAHPEDVVHLRVLLNDQGQVDDMQISPMGKDQFEAARAALSNWTFHPAHWGTLPVAAYLDVDVPISTPPLSRTAANSLGQ